MNEIVRRVLVFVFLVGCGMVACQSGNKLGVQLMSGDGQDLGQFTPGEKIVIPGILENATDSTRLLFAINLSPLRLLISPDGSETNDTKEFTIEIKEKDVFLQDGANELIIMRLDGRQQAEHSMRFELK